MAKRKRSSRRRRRGMGSIVRVRRAGGMGMLRGRMGSIVAPAVGGAVTAVTALSIGSMVDASASDTHAKLVKYGWLTGMGAGFLASGLLYFFGGRNRAAADLAASAATTSVIAGFFGWGMAKLIKEKGVSHHLVQNDAPPETIAAAEQAEGVPGIGNIVYQQLGAIVPEYQAKTSLGGLGNPYGELGGLGNPYGETVSLRGVNTSVFGTPGFQA